MRLPCCWAAPCLTVFFVKMQEKLDDASRLWYIGELNNTLVVVTSDNGMPFPRCKAACYEFGIHMPLAIRWGGRIKPGRVLDDFVSFTGFAPIFLEAAGADVPPNMTGKKPVADPAVGPFGAGRFQTRSCHRRRGAPLPRRAKRRLGLPHTGDRQGR